MNELCQPGKEIPDLDIVTIDGEHKNLHDYRGKWVVLLFRRYLGCPLCRMEVERLVSGDRPMPADMEVVIFIQSAAPVISEVLEGRLPEGMTAVADPEGIYFKRFGIGRANLTGYAGPRVILTVLKALRQGYRRGRREGEERQLPADLVVDPSGTIRYAHLADDISDTTPLEKLLEIKNEN